jgi:ribosomal protein S16
VAILGSYNPKLDHVQLHTEKVTAWLENGVQPSPTVHNILVSQGIIKESKVNVLPKKAPIVDEAAEAAKAAAAEGADTESTNEETTKASTAEDTEETAAPA